MTTKSFKTKTIDKASIKANYDNTTLVHPEIGSFFDFRQFDEPLVEDLITALGHPKMTRYFDHFGFNLLDYLLQSSHQDSLSIVMDESDKPVSFVHPARQFITDDQFYNQIVNSFHGVTDKTSTYYNHQGNLCHRFTISDHLTLPSPLNSELFSAEGIIERRSTGGMTFSAGLLRLACTNGSTVNEKGFHWDNLNSLSEIQDALASVSFPSLTNVIISRITDKTGSLINASVHDVLHLSNICRNYHDESASLYDPNQHFPIDHIREHYINQPEEIDVLSASTKTLKALPSGLTYWDAYNCATSFARTCPERQKVEVSATNSLMSKKKDLGPGESGYHYNGTAPAINPAILQRLRGEI